MIWILYRRVPSASSSWTQLQTMRDNGLKLNCTRMQALGYSTASIKKGGNFLEEQFILPSKKKKLVFAAHDHIIMSSSLDISCAKAKRVRWQLNLYAAAVIYRRFRYSNANRTENLKNLMLWYKLLIIIPTITEFQGYDPEINKICVFYMDILLSSNSAKTFCRA